LAPLYRYINTSLVAWARRKYKRFRDSKTRAGIFLRKVSRKCPRLFAHWQLGTAGAFA
jgi:RNA-directed DNA polymerase